MVHLIDCDLAAFAELDGNRHLRQHRIESSARQALIILGRIRLRPFFFPHRAGKCDDKLRKEIGTVSDGTVTALRTFCFLLTANV